MTLYAVFALVGGLIIAATLTHKHHFFFAMVSLTCVVIGLCCTFPRIVVAMLTIVLLSNRAKLRAWWHGMRRVVEAIVVKLGENCAALDTAADELYADINQNTSPNMLTESMVCKVCRTDIHGTADIIMERFDHTDQTRSMWYPNEMDILSSDDVPTYGGMKDPTGTVESYVVRVRCTPAILSKLARAHYPGDPVAVPPTRLNTWFPPHKWTVVFCRQCNPDGDPFRTLPDGSTLSNLGWLFTPPPGKELPPFLGLKVLELREKGA